MAVDDLLDATSLPEAQNAEYATNCARAPAGTLALGSLWYGGSADRDTVDATARLKRLVMGREWEPNENGRARAARRAEVVRNAASFAIIRRTAH